MHEGMPDLEVILDLEEIRVLKALLVHLEIKVI